MTTPAHVRVRALGASAALVSILAAGAAFAQQPPPQPPPGGQPPPPAPGYAPPPPGYAPAPPAYAPPGYAPAPQGYPPPGYYAQPYGYAPPPGYGQPYYYGPPQIPPPMDRPMKRRNPAMMGTGIAFTGVGAVGILAGAIVYGTASNASCSTNFGFEIRCTDQSQQTAGAVVMVIGAVLLAAGIPLWVVGGKKVPDTDTQPSTAVVVGPRSAALRWTF